MRDGLCPNFNHHRANPPVRVCPQCGETVNASIPQKSCSEEAHAKARREQNKFCIDCGELLRS